MATEQYLDVVMMIKLFICSRFAVAQGGYRRYPSTSKSCSNLAGIRHYARQMSTAEPSTDSGATANARWYVSAPAEVDLSPLLGRIRERGGEPYLLSDVADLGVSIIDSVRSAITEADLVLVVLSADKDSASSILEAGIALGLGKHVVLVADPLVALPPVLNGLIVIRAPITDLAAIDFVFDQIQGRAALSPVGGRSTGEALGSLADSLLTRASQLRETATSQATGFALEALIVEAIEASGAVAVHAAGRDQGFDLGVWSDDLDAIAANPILVEVKQNLRRDTERQALSALHLTPGAKIALIVYLTVDPADAHVMLETRFPVLAIQLDQLLSRMRSSSFAEVVRDLRNLSIHGGSRT